jgi:hypothetical protein
MGWMAMITVQQWRKLLVALAVFVIIGLMVLLRSQPNAWEQTYERVSLGMTRQEERELEQHEGSCRRSA